MIKKKVYHSVLTIAGSDSSAGAGVQADLKTFAALGCYGTSAITALTAQNTQGVQATQDIATDFVIKQINAVLDDINVDAIKIGMLPQDALVVALRKRLAALKDIPIVFDPVMQAQSGHALMSEETLDCIRSNISDFVTVLTPNLPEAESLLQRTIDSHADIEKAAKELCQGTIQAVLIKGGHSQDVDANDCLYLQDKDQYHWYGSSRFATDNTHGTGCTLSSAIAAFLAKGDSIADAVGQAKYYLTEAIQVGADYRLSKSRGKSYGPVHHFFNFW